jgi:hypothetical protein
MKTLLLLILITAAVFPAAAGDGALSGKWQLHQSIAGNDSDQACTFTQTGHELSGTCNGSELGTVQITGKVDNKKVNWMYKSEYNGSPLTMKYDGALESNKITGTVNVEEYGVDGDFTATLSK